MAGRYVTADGLRPAPDNPFVAALVENGGLGRPQSVKGSKGWASKGSHLVDPETGEMVTNATCLAHKTEVKDRGQFIKVFVAGLQATFDLSSRARKAFTAMMKHYSGEPVGPMQRNDMIIFDRDMAEEAGWKASADTFKSAMNELCHKEFLCPVRGAATWYWTNPTFFHRGDRLVVVNHYILNEADATISASACGDPDLDQQDFNGATKRDQQTGKVESEDVPY